MRRDSRSVEDERSFKLIERAGAAIEDVLADIAGSGKEGPSTPRAQRWSSIGDALRREVDAMGQSDLELGIMETGRSLVLQVLDQMNEASNYCEDTWIEIENSPPQSPRIDFTIEERPWDPRALQREPSQVDPQRQEFLEGVKVFVTRVLSPFVSNLTITYTATNLPRVTNVVMHYAYN